MFTFTCNEKDCANKEIEYNIIGDSPFAECGGCKAILNGTNERPDPEVQAPSFGVPEQE